MILFKLLFIILHSVTLDCSVIVVLFGARVGKLGFRSNGRTIGELG